MFLRTYSQIIIITFLLTNLVESAESSGMPQLNTKFWFSQIFWLILTFGILFVVLSKLILPKISKNLEIRKSQILENIETAEKQREESENKIKEYEKIIHDSKNEAKNYFNKAREKVLKDIDKKRKVLEINVNEEIEKELASVEKEIKNLKKTSISNINKIAIEAASEMMKKMVGTEINMSKVSAIVEDISKRKVERYL